MRRPVVFISLVLSGALAVSLVVGWAATRKPKPAPKVQIDPARQEIPEHVTYGFLFQHIAWLNKKAAELESQGKDASEYRLHYKQSANLSDKEAQMLDQVARETHHKVKVLDDEAKKIIAAVRAKTPDGKLQPGQKIPEPPAQLLAMQRQRDEVILAGIARLKSGFEQERLFHFQGFVQQHIGSKITNLLKSDSMPPRPGKITPEMLEKARRVQ